MRPLGNSSNTTRIIVLCRVVDLIAAVDIGGTKLAVALIDGLQVLERVELPTPKQHGPRSVIDALRALLTPLQTRAQAIGVAATGRVTHGRVTALNTSTLPGWTDIDLAGTLMRMTGRPTCVLNDADAAAWGEAQHGAGRGIPSFAFVTISTGIGSGIVLRGDLLQSEHGLHAELGFTLASNARPLEFLMSGAALDRFAAQQGWADGAREVLKRAQHEPHVCEKLDRRIMEFARKLADLKVLTGVTHVALGGGVGLNPFMLERVKAALTTLDSMYRVEVVAAQLGADAGLIGAATWAKQHLLEPRASRSTPSDHSSECA